MDNSDGLDFWRGLYSALPVSCGMWLVGFVIFVILLLLFGFGPAVLAVAGGGI